MKRAKLIDRLRELADYAEPREWDLPLDLADVLRAAVEELEAAAPPWIPVEEDEPPTGTTLLLSVRDPNFGLLYTTCGYQGARWHDIFDLPIDQERITHWMLLPEPPEEVTKQ